eukprot:6176065-Pleurochrysis_carterae.AAC.4
MHRGDENLGRIPRQRQACRCARSQRHQTVGEWPEVKTSTRSALGIVQGRARSRGVDSCLRGWESWRQKSMIESTTTPESSARRLRGAPASVVDRQRSGSNLRGVAP